MSRYLRIKKFFRTIPSRFIGTHVDEGEQITRLNSKAHFMPNELLEARIRAARDLIGHDVEVKSDRKKIEENPDTWQPVDYDRLPP